MLDLVYTDDASDDLDAIAAYIGREAGADVALHFIGQLRDRCAKLASLPGTLGTARSELRQGLRSTPCRGYVIFFQYLDNQLEIVRVLEGHRDTVSHFELPEDRN